MKLKILAAIVTMLLKDKNNENGPRADLYLPERILAMALVLIAVGIGFAVAFFVVWNVAFIAIAAVLIILSVFALLCWRNQTIRILDEEHFEYSTMFGNKKVYAFSDIKGLRRNSDSLTLFVGDGKVHIESNAIISDRLTEKIKAALERESN